jgi:uncharacterized protein
MGRSPQRGLGLTRLVPSLLSQRPNQRMSIREVVELVRTAKPDEWSEKQRHSGHSDAQARNQVGAEIASHRHDMQRIAPEFTWFDEPGSARLYAWIPGTEAEKDDQAEADSTRVETDGLPPSEGTDTAAKRLLEPDLYPMLATWLLSEFDLRSVRLTEGRSAAGALRQKNRNQWLFPDIVSVQDLRDGWHPEIREFANRHGAPRCRLWSFEVKLLINRATIRSDYLQAVYNSSWANYGYLVAAEISTDDFTMNELELLAQTHGVGVIALNTEDVANSRILIPAREKLTIDWRACERLFSANSDFQAFVKQVVRFYQTDELPRDGWLVEVEED